MDTIRVLRVIEYAGPRDAVMRQIANSCHAEYRMPSGVIMRVSSIDDSIRPAAERAFADLPVINGYPGSQADAREAIEPSQMALEGENS